MSVLLTVVIPTYNRSSFLDTCLSSMLVQVTDVQQTEVIVANNASTDNTREVIEKYISDFPALVAIHRPENIGATRNFADCVNRAKGRYLWIMGDDDYILPGRLASVLSLLEQNDFGVLHLVPVYSRDKITTAEYRQAQDLKIFNDPILFFEKLNFWASFISSNIVNLAAVKKGLDPYKYADSNLIQLGWTIPAIFKGSVNGIITYPMILCEPDNTGGYQFASTFGKNYRAVLNDLISTGIDSRVRSITTRKLMTLFFPAFVWRLLYAGGTFKKENHFLILLKTGWNYREYWKSVFPVYAKYFLRKIYRLVAAPAKFVLHSKRHAN